jgi:hypothetical protein
VVAFLIEEKIRIKGVRLIYGLAQKIHKNGALPLFCRKAIGGSGYVAPFEIENPQTATILAVGHPCEEDSH